MSAGDGGPAFPRPMGHNREPHYQGRATNDPQRGMSLRDWFAGQALTGMIAYAAAREGAFLFDAIAEDAYILADAMLAERMKEEG